MRQLSLVLLFGFAAFGVEAWTVTQMRHREDALLQALRLQQEELAKLSENVSALAELCTKRDRPSSLTTNVGSTSAPATVEAALRRALDQQAQEEKAKQAAATRPSEESVKAFAQGERIVDRAIDAKRWTETDRAALHVLMGQLTGEQHSQLLQRLSVAINEKTLLVQTEGPPF